MGPQREDLYQLTSYMTGYGTEKGALTGALIYPADPESKAIPLAERKGPWRLNADHLVHFLTLPHKLQEAANKLRLSVLPAGDVACGLR